MTVSSHHKSPRRRKECRIIVRSVRHAEQGLKLLAKIIADRVLQDIDEAAQPQIVSVAAGEKYY